MPENPETGSEMKPVAPTPDARLEDLPDPTTQQPSPDDEANIRGGGGAFIAETEKNIDAVLRPATRTNATLSFTESDNLFNR